MIFQEALAKGQALEVLKKFKAWDFPNGEWKAELVFFLDFPYARSCYFVAFDPPSLKGEKFLLTVHKEKGFKPSPDSCNMKKFETGQFALKTEPSEETLGNWIFAKRLD